MISCKFGRKLLTGNGFIYPYLTVATTVLLISEAVWPGFVRPYLNLSFWLLFWSASAILKVISINNQ